MGQNPDRGCAGKLGLLIHSEMREVLGLLTPQHPTSLSPKKYSNPLMKIQYIFFTIILLSLITAGCVSFNSAGSHTSNASPPLASSVSNESSATGYPMISPISTIVTAPPAVPSPARDSDLESQGSINKIYYYTLDGNQGFIPLEVYTGVNNYITSLGPIYTGDDYNAVISNEIQQEYIMPMVNEINSSAKNPDDDARIAISLVQHIKYDANDLNEIQVNESKSGQLYIGRYPYTILYQEWGGICGEKSFLLALLLKELGYNVALFEFDFGNNQPGHMAVGIKAPAQYTYENTGYALIESTAPVIPTFDGYYLVGMNAPMSSFTPTKVIQISDGKSFDTIGAEFSDAQIEQSVYSERGQVNEAAIELNASIQQLNTLESIVVSWKNRVQSDLSSGDMSTYQNDLQMYNQAYSNYENYYNTVYNPDYTTWNNLNTDFQNVYMPREMALENKYGMNRGINVGVAT